MKHDAKRLRRVRDGDDAGEIGDSRECIRAHRLARGSLAYDEFGDAQQFCDST